MSAEGRALGPLLAPVRGRLVVAGVVQALAAVVVLVPFVAVASLGAELLDLYATGSPSMGATAATTAYVGTSVTVPVGGTPQAPQSASNSAFWSSWPHSFVDFRQGRRTRCVRIYQRWIRGSVQADGADLVGLVAGHLIWRSECDGVSLSEERDPRRAVSAPGEGFAEPLLA
jgi:hypothetical protein